LRGFENIQVEFKHGVTPTLYFYGQDGTELSSTTLGNINLSELKSILATQGFKLQKPKMDAPLTPTSTYQLGNKFYEFFQERNYYQESKEFAESRTHNNEKGRLLTLECHTQEQHIRNWLQSEKISSHEALRVWLGASDSDSEGAWRWTSGPLANQLFWSNGGLNRYSNWRKGEPNNAGGENCANFMVSLFGWNDVDCDSEAASIVVEYGSDASDCLDQNEAYLRDL